MHESEIRRRGRDVRRRLQGERFLRDARAKEDPLWQALQDFIDISYGSTWGSERSLTMRERLLVTIAALAATGHPAELHRHIGAWLRNGHTVDELKEIAFQLALYCGLPATVGMWREVDSVVAEGDHLQ